MHSSIINKIRILKPRKKVVALSPASKKSFTISNDNCHSSIVLQDNQKDDIPPPLESPRTSEVEAEPKDKWVPFYVVNVPKVGLGLSSSLEPVICQINEKDAENQANQAASDSNVSTENTEEVEENLEEAAETTNEESVKTSQRVTRTRQIKLNNSVNCFLCPTKFGSVQDMQDHYLENHKHKKRVGAGNQKSSSKKVGRPSSKLKDPLKLTEGDSESGDGEPKCPICSIYFKTKDEVKDHMTNVHCYKCSECHNTFYTLFQFTDHRCSKYVKQKKPKLRKKKVKVVPSDKSKEEEEDPLALPIRKFVKIMPKNVPILPKPSYPLIIKYTTIDTTPPIFTQAVNTANTQPIATAPIVTATIDSTPVAIPISDPVSNSVSTLVSNPINSPVPTSIATSCSPKLSQNVEDKPTKSLLKCSLEELTSKEFNQMKLDEIIRNPNLSINWIPKKDPDDIQEFFSCGRCNVLCDDKGDYIEHLEECLRLSNVSLATTEIPPKRILRLKSEMIPQSMNKFAKTSINKKLLKQLKGFIGAENSDLFHVDDHSPPGDNISIPKSDLIHPDIKGNISITRLNKSTSSPVTRNNGLDSGNRAIVKVTQSVKHPLSSSTSAINPQQPMVIIPLNNSIQASQTHSQGNNTNNDPDYPDISITDKSNSVTYNFIGSESGAVLRVETPYQNSLRSKSNRIKSTSVLNCPKNLTLPQASFESDSRGKKTSSFRHTSSAMHETEVIEMKMEPSSPILSDDCEEAKNSSLMDDFKDSCSSMELVLDEDEIKMEVEDEVVDDRF